jgi:hypothetical protein
MQNLKVCYSLNFLIMSGKKYKVARAYSLRMLKDDIPGIYRKISDDIPSTRNPRTNRPLSTSATTISLFSRLVPYIIFTVTAT